MTNNNWFYNNFVTYFLDSLRMGHRMWYCSFWTFSTRTVPSALPRLWAHHFSPSSLAAGHLPLPNACLVRPWVPALTCPHSWRPPVLVCWSLRFRYHTFCSTAHLCLDPSPSRQHSLAAASASAPKIIKNLLNQIIWSPGGYSVWTFYFHLSDCRHGALMHRIGQLHEDLTF